MNRPLPRFRVDAVDNQTGEPFTFECVAADAYEASLKANAHGLSARHTHRVVEEPATERVASWLLSEGQGLKRSLVYFAVFAVLVFVIALIAMP